MDEFPEQELVIEEEKPKQEKVKKLKWRRITGVHAMNGRKFFKARIVSTGEVYEFPIELFEFDTEKEYAIDEKKLKEYRRI